MKKTKKLEEIEFHDKKIRGEVHIAPHYDCGVTAFAVEKFVEALGAVEKSDVLEIGCGDGWLTRILIEKGARVTALDISSECIQKTQKYLKDCNCFHNVVLIHSSLEELEVGKTSYDLIIGNAVLHHTKLEVTVKLIKLLLRLNGRAIFLEPLGTNVLLNFYRNLTPQYRTKDESPLRTADFKLFKDEFSQVNRVGFYFISLPLLYLRPFLPKLKAISKIISFAIELDFIIINRLSFLIKYSWYNLIVCKKMA